WWLGVAAVVLFVGGVVLLVVPWGAHSAAAGLASLIGAFGLTWKGIGEFFGRAAAKGEQALWDAQIDWTIAYRCTMPVDEAGYTAKHRTERIANHQQAWQDWLQRWPDLLGERVAAEAGTGEGESAFGAVAASRRRGEG